MYEMVFGVFIEWFFFLFIIIIDGSSNELTLWVYKFNSLDSKCKLILIGKVNKFRFNDWANHTNMKCIFNVLYYFLYMLIVTLRRCSIAANYANSL